MTLLLLFPLWVVGCATNMKDQFGRVQVGMEKNDVLDLVSSPQRTQRWKGMDRWTYIFYDDNHRLEKEVLFNEGKASYVGDVVQPEVSAAAQDIQNEVANREIEMTYRNQREENQRNFGVIPGSDATEKVESVVPEFKPVQ